MSFFLTLIYLFCIIIRPQDWMPALYNTPVAVILVFSTLMFLFFERFLEHDVNIIRIPQNGFLTAFFASIMMSHLVHTYFGGMFEAINAFLITYLSFYMIANAINSEFKLRIALIWIILMIFILVPQGMYQVQNGVGWAGQEIYYDFHREEPRINWVGIFNDPNDLALAFVVCTGILLAFAFGKTGFFIRLISMTMIGFLFYGIYLTNSRGGVLSLIAVIFFYIAKRTRRFLLGSVVGGLLAAVIIAFGPSRTGIISVQEASAMGRVELWYGGILMIKSNPLFGVGFNMYMADLPQTAHNSFILAAAELGLVGLFVWMGLIYSSFKGLSMVQDADKKLYNYALGIQTGLVGFCTAAFFLSRTYILLPYILFALSGSVMHIAKLRNSSLDYRVTKKDLKNIALLSFGVLLAAYAIIKIGL